MKIIIKTENNLIFIAISKKNIVQNIVDYCLKNKLSNLKIKKIFFLFKNGQKKDICDDAREKIQKIIQNDLHNAYCRDDLVESINAHQVLRGRYQASS